MNSSLVKSPMFHILESLRVNALYIIKRGRKSKIAPKAVEGFLLGYDSNTRAYRVFNKSTRLVEVSCDIVFYLVIEGFLLGYDSNTSGAS
jgi:hypothetical protein